MTMQDTVILVDEHDNPLGEAEKLAAHEQALCHRAFSIFILRNGENGIETLLQQRHPDKYHCGGLWTNSCCSHPRPGETILQAGQRRLKEELGFNVELTEVGMFHYIAKFDNGLTENEVDHVLVGWYEKEVNHEYINPLEVANTRWQTLTSLQQALQETPENFTPWLSQALVKIVEIV